MTTWAQVRERHIGLIRKSVQTIGHIIHSTTHEDATTYRDGGDGWTVTEVLCHLRDYDNIFFSRAVMIFEQDNPDLPAYDHEQLAIDNAYNEQDKDVIYMELATHREQFAQWFEMLTDDHWERTGTHPSRDYPFTLTDALMQIGLHDNDHIEQMTRILLERKS